MDFIFTQSSEHQKETACKDGNHEEHCSAVERQTEHVHEKEIDVCRCLGEAGDEAEKQHGEDDA